MWVLAWVSKPRLLRIPLSFRSPGASQRPVLNRERAVRAGIEESAARKVDDSAPGKVSTALTDDPVVGAGIEYARRLGISVNSARCIQRQCSAVVEHHRETEAVGNLRTGPVGSGTPGSTRNIPCAGDLGLQGRGERAEGKTIPG